MRVRSNPVAFAVGRVAGLERSKFRQCAAVSGDGERRPQVVEKQQTGLGEQDVEGRYAIEGVELVEEAGG